MADFTPTQARYLAYIHGYTERYGLPPTQSEIARGLDVTPTSVSNMLKALERKALIRRQVGVSRAIEILISPDAIPKWKGKRITSSSRVWMLHQPAGAPVQPTTGGEDQIYRF